MKPSVRQFNVRTLLVEKLWSLIQSGKISLIPETEAQPHLVEAFLFGIPCPPVLMHEDKNGDYISVGNATLEAVAAFIGGGFKIQYEGQATSYCELLPHVRRNLQLLPMQVVITEPTCPREIREQIEVMMGRRSLS